MDRRCRWSDIDGHGVEIIDIGTRGAACRQFCGSRLMVMEEFELILHSMAIDLTAATAPSLFPSIPIDLGSSGVFGGGGGCLQMRAIFRQPSQHGQPAKIGRRRAQEFDEDEELEAFADGNDDCVQCTEQTAG